MLAPGVGLGLDTGNQVRELIELEGGSDHCRAVASWVSRAIGDDQMADVPTSLRADVQLVLRRWLSAGGNPALVGGCSDQPRSSTQPQLDFVDLEPGLLSPRSSTGEVDWDDVEAELAISEIRLRRRATSFPDHTPVFATYDAEDRVVSEGKGLDAEWSRRSALGEAIERRLGLAPTDRGQLLCASRQELSDRGLGSFVPEFGPRDLFSDQSRIDWFPGRKWTGEEVWLPAESVFTHHHPQSGLHAASATTTTGLAAGATTAEAFANALFEVIERDAYWITMRCKLNSPPVPALEESSPFLVETLRGS